MSNKNQPDYCNSTHSEIAEALRVVRDVSGGTKAMRAAGETYLPKEPRETPTEYRCRLERAVLFNGYLKTVQAFVGAVFKEEIVLGKDVPALIREQIEDIDLAGNHLNVFAKRHFADQFEGYAFILVDMEPAIQPAPGVTRREEQERRPYWVSYKADQAFNWYYERVNGRLEFTQITFEEVTTERDGDYGEKRVTRYRTFRKANGVVEWELNRLNPEATGDDRIVFEDRGTTSLTRIPVALAGEIGKAPPLLDLAYLNILHWQNCADQEHILHITRVPKLVEIGADPNTVEIEAKATSSIRVPVGGDVKWLEVKADGAMKVGHDNILSIEQRMGMMGLSTLTQRVNSDITALEKKQDYEEKYSELATMAMSEKDCLELCLQFHAEYLRLPSGGSIQLGVKKEELTLSPEYLRVLSDAVKSNQFSLETFLTIVLNLLFQSGLLPDEVKVKDEKARIDEKMESAPPVPVLPPLPPLPIQRTENGAVNPS